MSVTVVVFWVVVIPLCYIRLASELYDIKKKLNELKETGELKDD